MSDKIKQILIIAAFLLLLSAFAFIMIQNHQLKQQQNELQQSVLKMKTLSDGTVRSEGQYVTKDQLDDFAKSNKLDLQQIQKDLSSLGGTIESINHLEVVTPGGHIINQPSTSHEANVQPLPPTPCVDGICKTQDPYGYLSSSQSLRLMETFPNAIDVPFGSVTFKSWEPAPWTTDISSRTYSVDSVVGEDDAGKQTIYNKMHIKTEGKDIIIPIESKMVQQVLLAKFRFSPRFYLGMDVGVGVGNTNGSITPEAQPSLQLSLFSYGRRAAAPDLTILNAGIGVGLVSHRPIASITPLAYNIGQHIPLMTNVQIGPGVGIGTDGNITVWVFGIKAGL